MRTEPGFPRRSAALGRVPRLEERSTRCRGSPERADRLHPDLGLSWGHAPALPEREREPRSAATQSQRPERNRCEGDLNSLPLPTRSPRWSGTEVGASEKARVRTLTGLFGTPRKDLRPEPSSSLLCLPPQDWAVARGPGGAQTVVVPTPPPPGWAQVSQPHPVRHPPGPEGTPGALKA